MRLPRPRLIFMNPRGLAPPRWTRAIAAGVGFVLHGLAAAGLAGPWWAAFAAEPPSASAAPQPDDEWQPTEGWHTLHHDVQRTGRTLDSPGAPFEYAWHREYWDELIAPEAEPIVAEGLVFIGTFKGLVHALDADTGQERWQVDLGSPIHHSPAYESGTLVAATLSPAAQVAAFEASSGRPRWRFAAPRPGGFAASPAIYQDHVYIGDRAGDCHALELAKGRPRWRVRFGAPILQTAAIKHGKLALAAEDLIPHLLDTRDGRVLWRAPQMNGATVRGYYPVFWRDRVVWRTDSGALSAYHRDIEQATEDGQTYRETRQKHGWSKHAEEVVKTLPNRYTEAKYVQEQEFVRAQMRSGKHPRSFYAFAIADGQEPVLHPIGYHASENGYSVPASPPVAADGSLYVFTKSVYSEWTYPIRAFDALSVLEPHGELPRLIRGIDRSRGAFPATSDESNNLTLAADKLFDTHDHVLAYMELASRRVINAFSSHAPELWGGVFKAYAPDTVSAERAGAWKLRDTTHSLHLTIQWNGPAQGAVAIYRDRVWWITGSMLVCLKGKVPP